MQHLYHQQGIMNSNMTSKVIKFNNIFPNDFHELVRLNEDYQIKPHAPPLVRTPVNSFKFQPCDRTTQADCLTR